MVWAKLDDGILDNPKVAAIGPIGFALYTASLVYANRNLTDGFIPYSSSRRLLPLETVDSNGVIWTLCHTSGMSGEDGVDCIDRAIGWLLEADLWEQVDGGYTIHDFGEWNRTKEEVLLERARISAIRSVAGKAGAQARWNGKDGKPIATPKQEERQEPGQNDGPVPVPVPVPKVKTKTSAPEGAGSVLPSEETAKARPRQTPNDITEYLRGRLIEFDEKWEGLTWPGVQKLINRYDRPVVNTALGYLRESPPVSVGQPFALLEATCKSVIAEQHPSEEVSL